MSAVPSTNQSLACFGAKRLLGDMLTFAADDPARDLTSLIGRSSTKLAHGTITITVFEPLVELDGMDLSELVFVVVQLTDAIDYQAFGIDRDDRVRLYLEIAKKNQYVVGKGYGPPHLEIADAIALDEPPIVAANGLAALKDALEEIFFGTINEKTKNPIVFGTPEGSGFVLAPGITESTYWDMCERAATCGLKHGSSGVEVCIHAATDSEPARIGSVYPKGQLTPFGHKLVEAVLDVCGPRGWSFHYNDGYRDRLSGYTKYPEALELKIEATSAIEKARLMPELARFLDEHLPAGHPARADILAQTPVVRSDAEECL